MPFPEIRPRRDHWQEKAKPVARTLCRNFSLGFQIALVAHHDDREVVLVLDAENLLLERHDFLERLPGGY